MCSYSDEGPEGLSVSDNNPERLDWALDEGERIHLIVDLGPTFWALYGGSTESVHYIPPCSTIDLGDEIRNNHGEMGERSIGNAAKDLWLLTDHEALIDTSNGGGL